MANGALPRSRNVDPIMERLRISCWSGTCGAPRPNARSADVVGLSVMTFSDRRTTVHRARLRAMRGARIVVGGYDPASPGEWTDLAIGVDIVRGEGT
jgi:hypothetical protein